MEKELKIDKDVETLADMGVRMFVRQKFATVIIKYIGKPDQAGKVAKELDDVILGEFTKIARDEISRLMSKLNNKKAKTN